MFFAKKRIPYVVFVTAHKMFWGGESLKSIVTVEFGHDVLHELEIANSRGLENQVLSAMEQFNLRPNEVIFILSEELYFSKDFSQQAEEDMKSYLSYIPFENVVSKRFQTQTGQRIVALSNDFLTPLVEIFEHRGFNTIAISPSLVLGENLKTEEQFTPEIVTNILHSLETILLYSLYTAPKEPDTITGLRDSEGKIFNPRLIFMMVFFVLLIGFLVAMLYSNGYLGKGSKNTSAPVATPASNVTSIPTVISPAEQSTQSAQPTVDDATASAVARDDVDKNVHIQVLNGTAVSGLADSVKTSFEKEGFLQVVVGNSSSTSQKTLVLYKPNISSQTLDLVTEILQSQNLEVSSQQSNELEDQDIRILLGKS